MELAEFIRDHWKEIDEVIHQECSNCPVRGDHERALWVMNNETLYNWARSEGVKI